MTIGVIVATGMGCGSRPGPNWQSTDGYGNDVGQGEAHSSGPPSALRYSGKTENERGEDGAFLVLTGDPVATVARYYSTHVPTGFQRVFVFDFEDEFYAVFQSPVHGQWMVAVLEKNGSTGILFENSARTEAEAWADMPTSLKYPGLVWIKGYGASIWDRNVRMWTPDPLSVVRAHYKSQTPPGFRRTVVEETGFELVIEYASKDGERYRITVQSSDVEDKHRQSCTSIELQIVLDQK